VFLGRFHFGEFGGPLLDRQNLIWEVLTKAFEVKSSDERRQRKFS
jgi:hypothetical protein